MIRARITTPWTKDAEGHNVPQFVLDYPGEPGEGWTDVTFQPTDAITPAPNAYTIEVTVTEETFVLIEADPNYTIRPGTVVDLSLP